MAPQTPPATRRKCLSKLTGRRDSPQLFNKEAEIVTLDSSIWLLQYINTPVLPSHLRANSKHRASSVGRSTPSPGAKYEFDVIEAVQDRRSCDLQKKLRTGSKPRKRFVMTPAN